ncbi:immunoglobulin lambda-1 light chain-like [Rhinatrema bivittatum]|uniref:immunoglobulin lambda-1 light chain-like n=1 Tax=Rhinatrema bivittatum TaxID=194408 RepID=UPI00112B76B2|nr:immunoglobulin lambda-1 light chain-like [Rhinatrema bivittatum]
MTTSAEHPSVCHSVMRTRRLHIDIMTAQLLCLTFIALSLGGCSLLPTVTQPDSTAFEEGKMAILKCQLGDGKIQDFHVFWFQQKPGNPPAGILKHGNDGAVSRNPGFSERFLPIRDSRSNSYILHIQEVKTEESAIYWCMVEANYFSTSIFGDGTRLSVFGGKDALPPSVTLLTSEQNISPSSVFNALCLADSFYPAILEIKWTIGGNITNSAIAGPAVSNRNGAYSQNSLLQLSYEEWKTTPSVACMVRHDSTHTVITKNLQECK